MYARPLSYNEEQLVWPPHCCVPAFLYSALGKCGVDLPDPLTLPKLLGVQVGPEDINPLQLRITEDFDQRGITCEQAVGRINNYLQKYYPCFAFRHIKFKNIQFKMYGEVLATALEKGLIVGIGVNYTLLKNRSGEVYRHLFRVESIM